MAHIKTNAAGNVKASKTYCTSKRFTNEWSFPLHPLHDFELDGETAHFASGHPRQWGDESHWLNFRRAMIGNEPSECSYGHYSAAVSPDCKLLAIASIHERLFIYDIESQELRQVLDGTGRLIFAPLAQEACMKTFGGPTPACMIGCSTSFKARRSGIGNNFTFWELGEQGRLLDQDEPIDAAAFAQQAVDAILPDLMIKHECNRDFVKASPLHAEFTRALSNVATTHRRRHNTTFEDADFGTFGKNFSSDGRYCLYHNQNASTQSGMRDSEKLPHVIVADVVNVEERYRLSGHTDSISWSAFGPDNQHIASVAWDGALRVYSAESGKFVWSTSGTGKAWTGAFSPDSRHIICSRGNGRTLVVHEVEGGRAVSTFPDSFHDWCRNLAWHPDGQQMALCTGKHAYVWRPFDGVLGKVTQHYQVEDDRESGLLLRNTYTLTCTDISIFMSWLPEKYFQDLYQLQK
ncbi:hypothetical protein E8E13_010854 [Curvularia kusanoi]|uniref:Uncharacterized protein n=1 Tax=Curvularia kusanoi TaxID=90978 RepID=A0A9P4TM81_CURKU|nr:hypothetical protein E8E13_010854 [Curvularia kusanoi]